MSTYYLSLCRGLTGYYVRFIAPNEEVVRRHALLYYGKLWCSVYSEAYFYEIIKKRYPKASRVINRNDPIILTTETGEFE